MFEWSDVMFSEWSDVMFLVRHGGVRVRAGLLVREGPASLQLVVAAHVVFMALFFALSRRKWNSSIVTLSLSLASLPSCNTSLISACAPFPTC